MTCRITSTANTSSIFLSDLDNGLEGEGWELDWNSSVGTQSMVLFKGIRWYTVCNKASHASAAACVPGEA